MALTNLLSLNFLVPFAAAKIDFSRAIRGLRGMPRRMLLIGHKLPAGSLPLDSITTVSTEADAIDRFGEGSMLVQMWRAANANVDLGLPIDCIALKEGNLSVAASSVIKVTNAGANISMPGEVMLYIGGQRVSVGVTTTDTPQTVAAKMIAMVNAQPKLGVTAAATANLTEVKLTCRWGGPTGGDIDLRSAYYWDDRLPNGLTLDIPKMSGGAVNPDVTMAIVAMNLYRATEIVCPFTDSTNLNMLETELAARWEANNMQDAAVINCVRGTESEITTFLASRNSPHVHTITVTKDCTNPWETAAMAGAGIESLAAKDPALPQTGVVLLGYVGPRRGDHWQGPQLANLLAIGGSPLEIAQDSTGGILRMVTNYTMNRASAPDRSMAELCWIKTMSYYRWFVITEFQIKYRGFKIAQYVIEPIPGQDKLMTKELAEEIMIGLYDVLLGVALVQHPTYYKEKLLVEIDGPNGKLKMRDEPVIVTQHYQTELTSYPVAGQV